MKALREDGTVIDLGHKHVRIQGEPGDEAALLMLARVEAVALDCRFEAHRCYLTAESQNTFDASAVSHEKGQA